ncbi:hypothetical protein [Streptomyces sp. NPDC056401]|uniref:hypothetical protein n=1 Tax=Streptomyces sp. NPDC056401 TaxID=3345809 RepID=UPI0035DBC2CD
MGALGGEEVTVWRVVGGARPAAYVMSAVVVVKAVACWFSWMLAPTWAAVHLAGMWTGLATGACCFLWWVILRVRLEIGPQLFVAVNPWGTQRLPLEQVTHVTLGNWGAEFHQTDGFKTTSYALSDMAGYAGKVQGAKRFREVQAALERVRRPA